MSKALTMAEGIPHSGAEAGWVYKELVVYVLTEKHTHKFVDVFLTKEAAVKYNEGIGCLNYSITPVICS